ncbi:hypothetical protein GXB85_16745 [Cellulomonas sp. APG4]|uniref:hypothetical protein n=1 Tax=Cellulomonas sp. APG4 TaxID=1538656 RepID=UPI001379B679|nr:hypothetical protein [Cellulomonas sp. APG4]NCT92584.1 hypothetical protein [Cellulomonas sp. APG4]
MATFSSVTKQHVLTAIAEHDERGAEAFCALYGFTPSSDSTIVHEGRRYDTRAVLAVAHRHATGRLATPEEFRSSLQAAVGVLQRRGFEVVGPAAARTAPARASSTRTPRTASSRPAARRTTTREDTPSICPTCSMALPATGVCDMCA